MLTGWHILYAQQTTKCCLKVLFWMVYARYFCWYCGCTTECLCAGNLISDTSKYWCILVQHRSRLVLHLHLMLLTVPTAVTNLILFVCIAQSAQEQLLQSLPSCRSIFHVRCASSSSVVSACNAVVQTVCLLAGEGAGIPPYPQPA